MATAAFVLIIKRYNTGSNIPTPSTHSQTRTLYSAHYYFTITLLSEEALLLLLKTNKTITRAYTRTAAQVTLNWIVAPGCAPGGTCTCTLWPRVITHAIVNRPHIPARSRRRWAAGGCGGRRCGGAKSRKNAMRRTRTRKIVLSLPCTVLHYTTL